MYATKLNLSCWQQPLLCGCAALLVVLHVHKEGFVQVDLDLGLLNMLLSRLLLLLLLRLANQLQAAAGDADTDALLLQLLPLAPECISRVVAVQAVALTFHPEACLLSNLLHLSADSNVTNT
jgi:hypothetical protein